MTDSSLPDRAVHVWWAGLDDAHDGLARLLDPVERARLDAYARPDDRHRFLLGCAVSRIALGAYLGADPADVGLVRQCPQCGGPHGKVRLRDAEGAGSIRFSVTHGGRLVGVAFCRAAEVGLDVEPTDQAVDVDELAPDVLTGRELAALAEGGTVADRRRDFLRFWCRKEAVVKALGVGMRTPFRRLEVTAPREQAAVVAWSEHPEAVGTTRLYELNVGPEHEACLAVLAPEPLTVVPRRAGALLRSWAAD
ncbi:4'-phosphopantetheinyl transferase family protein [Streptomyces sp. bgisy100]|uniref:4'-phosphopantetheinyl transferase family protein n=1 Tax=Streptomyces sp. bgisy100 TaxID=3413783 RepID=UPI003D7627B7